MESHDSQTPPVSGASPSVIITSPPLSSSDLHIHDEILINRIHHNDFVPYSLGNNEEHDNISDGKVSPGEFIKTTDGDGDDDDDIVINISNRSPEINTSQEPTTSHRHYEKEEETYKSISNSNLDSKIEGDPNFLFANACIDVSAISDIDDNPEKNNNQKELDTPISSIIHLQNNFTTLSIAPLSPSDITSLKPLNKVSNDYDNSEENLAGDDFLDTPWLKPSIEKAKLFRSNRVFRKGIAPLNTVKVTNSPDLGPGICLYFTFIKHIAIGMFFLTIFSMPSLIFSYYGHAIEESDQDIFGLYKFTIGNIGYNRNSLTYTTDSRCTSPDLIKYKGTCIHLMDNTEMTLVDASYIIASMEFLQVLIYLIITYILWKDYNYFDDDNRFRKCNISDYTIAIKGIKKSLKFTAKELIDHFSDLYSLDKIDWKGRKPVSNAKRVQDISNSQNISLTNTWVADFIIHNNIGSILRKFRREQHLIHKLHRSRAQMKLYKHHHVDAERFRKAEKLQEYCTKSIETMKQVMLTKINALGTHSTGTSSSPIVISGSEVSFIFLTFEYCESFARCIEDYEHFSSLPWSLCCPQPLKFKGCTLRISRASEPDSIIWENLGKSYLEKFLKRSFTNFITAFLMIVCFVLILQFTSYEKKFTTAANLVYCKREIPMLFLSSYNSSLPYLTGVKGTSMVQQMTPTRPALSQQASLDAQCSAIIKGSYYVTYNRNENLTSLVGKYDIAACSQSSATAAGYSEGGACPSYKQTVMCPCISETFSEVCPSLGCGTKTPYFSCFTYTAATLGNCYCKYQLLKKISVSGILQVVDELYRNRGTFVECTDFYNSYMQASSFKYFSILSTTLINIFSRAAIVYFADREGHTSVDLKNASILFKMFLSLYFNLAVLVLIASGRVDNQPSVMSILNLLNGSFDDFTSTWYGSIGSYFILTVCIDASLPLIINFTKYVFLTPITRLYVHLNLRFSFSHSVVRQHELNQYQVGPTFDETINFSHLLALLFFCMTYAPGLPITMPLLAIIFTCYFIQDKILLCRWNAKPPAVGTRLMRVALVIMPYAAVIRLGFACWMFSRTFNEAYTDPIADVDDYGSENYIGHSISLRITYAYILPLFFSLIIVLAIQVFHELIKNTPILWLLNYMSKQKANTHNKNKKVLDLSTNVSNGQEISSYEIYKLHHPLRREVAPFTGTYFRFLPPKSLWSRLQHLGESSKVHPIDNNNKEIDPSKDIENNKLQKHEGEQNNEGEDEDEDPEEIALAHAHSRGLRDSDLFEADNQAWINVEIDGRSAKMKKRIQKHARKSFFTKNFSSVSSGKSEDQAVEYMTTYQLIGESSCNRYDIERIPAYAIVSASGLLSEAKLKY